MVATQSTLNPAPPTLPDRAAHAGLGRVRFTYTDVLAMIGAGVLPEDSTIELLDGELVYRDTRATGSEEYVEGFRHSRTVSRLNFLAATVNGPGRHLLTQITFRCTETYSPVPDAAIFRGTFDDYTDVPTAADVLCLIEVADSSYERDTTNKLAAYARAGVPQYVVINLRNNTAEVYEASNLAEGTYRSRVVVQVDQSLVLRLDGGETHALMLSTLLP